MITITYEFLPLSTINDMIIQNNNINELLDNKSSIINYDTSIYTSIFITPFYLLYIDILLNNLL